MNLRTQNPVLPFAVAAPNTPLFPIPRVNLASYAYLSQRFLYTTPSRSVPHRVAGQDLPGVTALRELYRSNLKLPTLYFRALRMGPDHKSMQPPIPRRLTCVNNRLVAPVAPTLMPRR